MTRRPIHVIRALRALVPLAIFAIAGAFASQPAHAGELVQNGGFEDPAVPLEDLDGGIPFVAPTMLPGGWELASGSVDVLRRSGATSFQVPEGLQALDLTGMGSRGTIRRTLELENGPVYLLTFWLAGNPTCEQGIKRMNLVVENILFAQLTFDTRFTSVTNMQWAFYEYAFAGSGKPVTLQFQSTTGTNCGVMLDDISVSKCLEIILQPESVRRCEGRSALLTASAAGDTVGYRWFRQGVMLADNASFSGSGTAALTINAVTPATIGSYTCIAFNVCGQIESAPAMVTIGPRECPGDATGDGAINFADITGVLGAFNLTDASGEAPADVNCDGAVNFADITTVLENFGINCAA